MRKSKDTCAHLFSTLWNATSNPMWICRLLPDGDYRFEDLNDNCLTMLPGLSRGSLMSQLLITSPENPLTALLPALGQCLATGKTDEVLLQGDRTRGQRTFKVDLIPIPHPDTPNSAALGHPSILCLACALDNAFTGLVQQNEELRKAGERYLDLALKDPLTGLANRRCFQEVADKEFDRARRYNRQLTLILLDMDNLKLVNDEQGHQAGDAALKAIGVALSEVSRTTDTVARIGGDEFALILPETSCADGIRIAARARAATARGYLLPDGRQAYLSLSAGAAGIASTDATFDAIFVRSDRALYRAKNTGKNRTEADCPDLP